MPRRGKGGRMRSGCAGEWDCRDRRRIYGECEMEEYVAYRSCI